MKNLILSMLLFSVTACEKTEEVSSGCQEKTPNPNVACITLYDPVCGCNNKTYGNSCVANAHGITNYTKGECK